MTGGMEWDLDVEVDGGEGGMEWEVPSFGDWGRGEPGKG